MPSRPLASKSYPSRVVAHMPSKSYPNRVVVHMPSKSYPSPVVVHMPSNHLRITVLGHPDCGNCMQTDGNCSVIALRRPTSNSIENLESGFESVGLQPSCYSLTSPSKLIRSPKFKAQPLKPTKNNTREPLTMTANPYPLLIEVKAKTP